MSQSAIAKGALAAIAILKDDPNAAKQYGVKGMKWGVTTKDRAHQMGPQNKSEVTVTQKKPGSFAKTEGGKGLPMHEDAAAALTARQKAKASTTDALSNKELQAAVTRMNLEQQYANLAYHSDRRGKGMRFVQGLMGNKRYGMKEKRRFTDPHEELGQQVGDAVKSEAGKAVAKKVAKKAVGAIA
jgi:hypothetical protein